MGEAKSIRVPLPLPRPGAYEQATYQYPILKNSGVVPQYNYGNTDGRKMEYWPQGEPGSPQMPRPQNIPLSSPGVEILSKDVRPIDILGDVASHQLVNTDPTVAAAYNSFKESLSGDQRARLRQQYEYAQKNYGETRPYQDWETTSGLPAYFRGYTFDQWPKEFNDVAYSADQRGLLDGVMNYLRGGK